MPTASAPPRPSSVMDSTHALRPWRIGRLLGDDLRHRPFDVCQADILAGVDHDAQLARSFAVPVAVQPGTDEGRDGSHHVLLGGVGANVDLRAADVDLTIHDLSAGSHIQLVPVVVEDQRDRYPLLRPHAAAADRVLDRGRYVVAGSSCALQGGLRHCAGEGCGVDRPVLLGALGDGLAGDKVVLPAPSVELRRQARPQLARGKIGHRLVLFFLGFSGMVLSCSPNHFLTFLDTPRIFSMPWSWR